MIFHDSTKPFKAGLNVINREQIPIIIKLQYWGNLQLLSIPVCAHIHISIHIYI